MVEDVVRALGTLTLGSRLKRIGERLQSETQTLLAAAGFEVPAGQYPVLAALDRMGPARIGDITQALGIAQPGVTRLVDRLAEAGLLSSEPAPGDRRVRTVALTPDGERLVADSKRAVWPVVRATVADACAGPPGSLLERLAALEDALDAASLAQRAARLHAQASAAGTPEDAPA